MAYTAIAVCVLVINVFTYPDRFADFENYVLYLNGLVHFPLPSWIYFETFSNFFLLGMYEITRSVFSAMVLAHYVLGALFVAVLLAVFPPKQTTWPVLLFSFAMLGPLLAFVTMRATPAYFLVAIGVRLAADRRPAAWWCLLVATFFHISTLLAAVPLALLYFERNLPAPLKSDRSQRYYLFMALAIMTLGALLPELSGSIAGVIQSIPVISKYDIYTKSTEAGTQIGHYIFLVFVSALTVAFIVVRKAQFQKLNIYILFSFGLYVMMFFSASPVAAFRQAPFWMISMIAALPWEKMGVGRATVPLFVFGCAGLFAFQFGLVYL